MLSLISALRRFQSICFASASHLLRICFASASHLLAECHLLGQPPAPAWKFVGGMLEVLSWAARVSLWSDAATKRPWSWEIWKLSVNDRPVWHEAGFGRFLASQLQVSYKQGKFKVSSKSPKNSKKNSKSRQKLSIAFLSFLSFVVHPSRLAPFFANQFSRWKSELCWGLRFLSHLKRHIHTVNVGGASSASHQCHSCLARPKHQAEYPEPWHRDQSKSISSIAQPNRMWMGVNGCEYVCVCECRLLEPCKVWHFLHRFQSPSTFLSRNSTIVRRSFGEFSERVDRSLNHSQGHYAEDLRPIQDISFHQHCMHTRPEGTAWIAPLWA